MKHLKELRKNHHLSQSELSHFLHISQQSICKYESGHSEASETLLIKTAHFFGTSVDYLLGLCDSPINNITPANEIIPNPTPEETVHMYLYRHASKEQKQAIDILLKSCIHHSQS